MAPDITQNNSLSHVKDEIAITIKKMRKWIVLSGIGYGFRGNYGSV